MAVTLPVLNVPASGYRFSFPAPLGPGGSGLSATSAAGAGVSLVLPADATPRPINLSQIFLTQSATGTAAVLTIQDGATEIFRAQIASPPPLSPITFVPPLVGTPGNAMTITVTGAGGSVLTSLAVNAFLLA